MRKPPPQFRAAAEGCLHRISQPVVLQPLGCAAQRLDVADPVAEALLDERHGFVYCVDDSLHCVHKFTPEGKLVWTLGESGKPAPKWLKLVDLARHAVSNRSSSCFGQTVCGKTRS